ncbi:reverse transcriptase domain-containing protein [Tanacetum coccineum]
MLPVTQIHTFYNGLILRHRDTINAAAGGTFMKRRPEECYDLNKIMTAHHNDWDTLAQRGESSRSITSSSPEIAALTNYETCGGPHYYSECQAAGGFTQGDVYAATGNYNAGANQMTKIEKDFNERPLGALPSNTIPNPKEDIKEMEQDLETTMDQVHILSSGSTARVPSSVIQPAPTSKSNEIPEQNLLQAPIPYPSKLNKDKLQDKYNIQIHKFLQMFKKLHFNISFAEVLAQMPKYAKMLKVLFTIKEKLLELANTPLNENFSAVILKKLPEKLGVPGKFLIPCDFSELHECLALADLGASINLMSLSVWKKLMLPKLTPTHMNLELANRSVAYPVGIAEDVFMQVGKFTFPADFVVVDYDVDPHVPLILGRPFLRTVHALVDVYGEELTLRVGNEKLTFNVARTLKYPHKHGDDPTPSSDPVVASLSPSLTPFEDSDFLLEEIDAFLALDDSITPEIDNGIYDSEGDILFLEKLLNDDTTKDLPPKDPWVSPVHVVPKKGGMKVVTNDNNELILTRLVTGWCVCIDYVKLNDATHKDHFRLPLMDQMLERLAGNEFYYFLDGFLGISKNLSIPKTKKKTTFTCPFGTFAYRRMPFGLCNALGTFQRFMVAIFHDMIEKTMEVFMDDFLVFGDSFSFFLSHRDMMLKRSEDTNLVLNWEKCNFMVKDGIVFGHKISKNGIEVNRAKVDVISKLPPPTTFLNNKLTEAPILVAPDWNLPFEIMCDASDFVFKSLISRFAIKKRAKNLVADHLSKLENPYKGDLVEMEMNDNFPHECLNMIALNDENKPSWFADIANYLVGESCHLDEQNPKCLEDWENLDFQYLVVNGECFQVKVVVVHKSDKTLSELAFDAVDSISSPPVAINSKKKLPSQERYSSK